MKTIWNYYKITMIMHIFLKSNSKCLMSVLSLATYLPIRRNVLPQPDFILVGCHVWPELVEAEVTILPPVIFIDFYTM